MISLLIFEGVVFYHGAPFKFNTSLRGQHNRYIYGVAFSPDGSLLVSVGADKKIWLYDGKTGEVKGQVGEGQHTGSIFSVSWSKDSKSFATSSADQTVKLWDVAAEKCIQSWRLGEEGSVSVPDHQVGVTIPPGRTDGLIISLNLAGDLNYLIEGSQKPQKVVCGHQKNITAASVTKNGASNRKVWTGSSDGRLCSWDISNGSAERIDGETHTNYVSGIDISGGRIFSVGWDDTLRSVDTQANTFLGGAFKTDGQPKGVAAVSKKAIVATHKGIEIVIDGQKTGELKTKYSPSIIAASDDLIAVGGDDSHLHVYSISSNSLSPQKDIHEPSSLITALAFSPDQSLLAVGCSNGKIIVYKCGDWTVVISRWSSHTGRITSITWNASGTHAASSSLDTNIFVWSVARPGTRVSVANAHKDGVNAVAWVDDSRLVSAGGDASLKLWKVEGLV